ncbi:MAG: DJ-1/PfpI family protein [Clostridia bacterium]|nr:DJ-1/PfpI family protein [Clostridia bacterium]
MVYLFLAEGFEEIEALTPVDLLRRADIEVCTVGIGDTDVCGAHGITVKADIDEATALYYLEEKGAEMIILPGGMPGSTNLDKSETVDDFLCYARENGTPYAAICAAPFVLGKRGMLENKKAVCYPGFEDELRGATIVNEGTVRDGNTVCGRAMGSAIDFALQIITLLRGSEAAEKIKKAIIY